jgi:signal peptidase I
VLRARELLIAGSVAAAATTLLTFGLRRRLSRLTVTGHSMSPTLLDGQRVWLWHPGRHYQYRVNQLVAFEHWRGHGSPPLLVKRVATPDRGALKAVGRGPTNPGEIWVLGDGENSLDSRQLGPIPYSSIRGVVLRRKRQCG